MKTLDKLKDLWHALWEEAPWSSKDEPDMQADINRLVELAKQIKSEVIPEGFLPNGDFEPHQHTHPTSAQIKAEIAKAVRPPTPVEIKAANAAVRKAIHLGLDPERHNLKEIAGLTPDDLVPNGYKDGRIKAHKKPAKKTTKRTTKKRSK